MGLASQKIDPEKKLVVSGQTIFFRQDCEVGEGVDWSWTDFYTIEGKVPEKKWNWKRFRFVPTGKMLDNYVWQFKFGFWLSESTHLTKDELKRKLERQVELIGRRKELKEGVLL